MRAQSGLLHFFYCFFQFSEFFVGLRMLRQLKMINQLSETMICNILYNSFLDEAMSTRNEETSDSIMPFKEARHSERFVVSTLRSCATIVKRSVMLSLS